MSKVEMLSGLTIHDVQARAVFAPLKTPLITSAGSFPKALLVLIDLNTEEGNTQSSATRSCASASS